MQPGGGVGAALWKEGPVALMISAAVAALRLGCELARAP